MITGSSGVRVEGVVVRDSRVAAQNVMYFNRVAVLSIRDVVITNVTSTIGSLSRVIMIEAIAPIDSLQINHVNFTNITYSNSQLSFFNLLGSQ